MRIAVMFDHFGPYHWARLRGAAKFCDVVGLELFGQTRDYSWERATGQEPALSDIVWCTLLPSVHRTAASPAAIQRAVHESLGHYEPEAVAIPGWSDQGGLAALDWCARNGVPAVLMSESQAHDEPRTWLKEAIKQRIVRLCTGALVGGTPHKKYIAALGMAEDRVFCGYDVVDNGHFTVRADEARTGASVLRESLSLPERYFLASKRFIPKKNLRGLIKAFALFRREAGPDACDLVVLGNGPLEEDLQRWCQELGIARHVHRPGFKQYDETPIYYGLAEAFIHASTTEQWGLVVNEAMASRLPVLVSNRCGCAADLVQHGVNGFTFDPENVVQLSRAMLHLDRDADLQAMGKASQQIIGSWSPETFGQNLLAAARQESRRRADISLADSMMLRLLTTHPPQNADSMAYVRHRRTIVA